MVVSLKTQLKRKASKAHKDLETNIALQKANDLAREKKLRRELPLKMKKALQEQVKEADSFSFSRSKGTFSFCLSTDEDDGLSHTERERAFEKALKAEKFKILQTSPVAFSAGYYDDGYGYIKDSYTTTWEVELR